MRDGKECNRREFMAKPLTYLASAGLLSASGNLPGLDTLLAAEAPATGNVIHRQLGRTGLRLPVVSMGVMNAEVPGILVRAYELGVRHFDTAAMYQGGRSEEMVGRFVKEHGVRDKVVIATKVYLRPELRRASTAECKAEFLKIFEGSLRRLQMDYVDILYSHSIDDAAAVKAPGIVEALTELKKAGKIRFSGISNHVKIDVTNAAADSGLYDVILAILNFTMSEYKPYLDALRNAAAKGVGVVAMKTQAGGLLGAQMAPPKSEEEGRREHRRLQQENENNMVGHAAALKWVLQNKFITTAIPGVTKYEQIDLDFSVASNLEYTAEERRFLADKSIKASLEFCQQCGECVPTCPQRVAIPALMRTHMYARQYGNDYQARFTLAQLPKGSGLDACQACPVCTAACAQTVDIARKIGELKTVQLA